MDPSPLQKLLCCAKEINLTVQNIRALEKEIETLGKLDYDTAGVFITFEREEHQRRVLNTMQMPSCCKGKKEEDMLFKGVSLDVSEPGEPSSICWDDLEVGPLVRNKSNSRYRLSLLFPYSFSVTS